MGARFAGRSSRSQLVSTNLLLHSDSTDYRSPSPTFGLGAYTVSQIPLRVRGLSSQTRTAIGYVSTAMSRC